MSMSTYTCYGCGIITTDVTVESAKKFFEAHEKTIKELNAELFEYVASHTAEELEEECYDILFNDDSSALLSVIADCMTKETGITFGWFIPDEDGKSAIMFTPDYPWRYTEKETQVSETELMEIIREYAEELGAEYDSDIKVEYYG